MNLGELLVLLCWDKLNELLLLVISFGCEMFWEETWVLYEKLVQVILENQYL